MGFLELKDLSVKYFRRGGEITAVKKLSLSVTKGETLAVVGESGCGKSSLALSIPGLIFPHEGRISGSVIFDGTDLAGLDEKEIRKIRGRRISVIFQDPFSSLDPVHTAGDQLKEAVLAHYPDKPARQVEAEVRKALEEVMFQDPERILRSYPHQLSGGQRQRIVIAMAVINRPELIIADEPTTALDVTIQKEVLDLLDRLKKELSLTMILITHNLAVARARSERTAVMYAGELVELGPSRELFDDPCHPYTKGLIASIPGRSGLSGKPALSGQPPDPAVVFSGCCFEPRCPLASAECSGKKPELAVRRERSARCVLFKGGV